MIICKSLQLLKGSLYLNQTMLYLFLYLLGMVRNALEHDKDFGHKSFIVKCQVELGQVWHLVAKSWPKYYHKSLKMDLYLKVLRTHPPFQHVACKGPILLLSNFITYFKLRLWPIIWYLFSLYIYFFFSPNIISIIRLFLISLSCFDWFLRSSTSDISIESLDFNLWIRFSELFLSLLSMKGCRVYSWTENMAIFILIILKQFIKGNKKI